ncbi:MAG: glycosyltransferase family 2 protein [Phycisphaerales bacterium]
MHVTIGIITSGRPDGLLRLIGSLDQLTFSDEPPAVEILVVDNHPEQTARECLLSIDCAHPLRYEVESNRGIPHARNAVITLAKAETDFIVFIDDDQTADPHWLDALLKVQRDTKADVVTGPAIPQYPESTPPWVPRCGGFDLHRFPTGTERPFAFTHNVMTKRSVFDRVHPHFDLRLVSTGASDTHFFRRVAESGHRIIWADEAIAYEWIPAKRMNARWLLQRALRIGGTDTFIERDLAGNAKAIPTVTVRAIRYAIRGILRCITGCFEGKAGMVRAGRDFMHAAGLVAGLLGYRYPEYKRAD